MNNSIFSPELDFITTSRNSRVVGVKFPLERTEGGDWSKSYDKEAIFGSIKQLILTQKGERVMYPNFGTNLRRYLFEPITQALISSIDTEIRMAIKTYEPRINVIDVRVSQTPGDNREFNGLYIALNLSFIDDAASEEQIDIILTS